MKKRTVKTKFILVSLATAMSVGLINTASTVIAYRLFLPDKPVTESEPLISSSPEESSSSPRAVEPSAPTTTTTTTSPVQSSKPAKPVTVRKPGAAIVVGAAAQPAAIVTNPDGKVVYRWCSGTNPNLQDAICEAVISIAANPTSSNTHLSDEAKKSLSLLPKDCTLTIDEASWSPASPTKGTMLATAHTKLYGDVHLKVTLEKINGVWIVADGQLS